MDGPVGGRRGKRTGSPIPEGTALSMGGGAACEQGRGRRGGERLTASGFAAPKEQRPGGCWSPRAGRAYWRRPRRRRPSGCLRPRVGRERGERVGGVAAQCVALTRSVPGGCSLPAWVQQTKGAPTLSVLNAGADHEASRSQGAIGAATPASVQSWQWLSWQCGWRCGWWCGQRHGQCTGGSGWAWHAWQRTPGRAGAACRRRRRAASGEHDGAPWTSTWKATGGSAAKQAPLPSTAASRRSSFWRELVFLEAEKKK